MISNCKKYASALLLFFVALNGSAQVRDLDFYITEALRNSPLLNDLRNQFNSASIDSLIIRAQSRPQAEGRSLLLYAPFNKYFGYDEVITDGGNYEAVGYVSQNIFNRKSIENKYRSAGTLKEGLGINRKISQAELKRLITSLYLQSFSISADLAFNRSFLDLLHEQDRIISQFVRAGIFRQADYLSLLVETQGQEVLVSQLENEYEKNTGTLNEACGIVDTSHVDLQVPDIKPLSVTTNPGNLFLEPFRIDSLQIINEKAGLDLRYKPIVSWFADAGVLTSNPWNFYRHFGVSAGISLSIPIYDGQQKKLGQQKLTLRENSRSFYSISSKKLYDQQYLKLQGELEGMKAVRDKLAKQLEISDQLVRSLRSELETGYVRMTDYLNALKSYRNIRHSLNMTDIAFMSVVNDMNYILSE
ncbi:MAG: TolC family protein [Bacteroidales bacterium]